MLKSFAFCGGLRVGVNLISKIQRFPRDIIPTYVGTLYIGITAGFIPPKSREHYFMTPPQTPNHTCYWYRGPKPSFTTLKIRQIIVLLLFYLSSSTFYLSSSS